MSTNPASPSDIPVVVPRTTVDLSPEHIAQRLADGLPLEPEQSAVVRQALLGAASLALANAKTELLLESYQNDVAQARAILSDSFVHVGNAIHESGTTIAALNLDEMAQNRANLKKYIENRADMGEILGGALGFLLTLAPALA